MTENDYAPLSASCVRALNDKLYEKRKVAALEIEKMVKDFILTKQFTQIKKLLKVLGEDFAASQNPNSRKGGLIGLAALAIALGKESSSYIDELVKPVLSCFHDPDSRVRYYACEALYNIVKVARGSVLPYFNEVFDGLSKLTADPDQNVKSGTELLDRLIKDIVTESPSFDLVAFVPLLRERVYTRVPFARQFVVSWIGVLDAVPDINMLVLLPEILDGLFQILGDISPEIRRMCQSVLSEFLQGIQKSKNGVNFAGMANILIIHSQSQDELLQFTALTWLKEFVHLAGRSMLPFTSGIMNAVLPCLAIRERRNVKEAARKLNDELMKLVSEQDNQPTPTSGLSRDVTPDDSNPINILDKPESSTNDSENRSSSVLLDVASVIKVLCQTLSHASVETRIESLRWFIHLLNKVPNKTFQHTEKFFPLLLKTLSDPDDGVVQLDLEALAEISSNPAGHNVSQVFVDSYKIPDKLKDVLEPRHGLNQYFNKFMVGLLEIFKSDRTLLEDKGPFVIRQLSVLINAEEILRTLAEILNCDEDFVFSSTMVQVLNTIVLTATELFELRNQLKELKTEESCSLFCCLYKCWCHSPVATVSLCYLTQNYQHACDVLQTFGDLEITVEFLKEIDKLVQLIESPIFSYLRLQLLDVQNNQHLIKSLYGLLMLLPQSEAFKLLHYRLQCIPHYHLAPETSRRSTNTDKESRKFVNNINFKELLEHFLDIQSKHREQKLSLRKSYRFKEAS